MEPFFHSTPSLKSDNDNQSSCLSFIIDIFTNNSIADTSVSTHVLPIPASIPVNFKCRLSPAPEYNAVMPPRRPGSDHCCEIDRSSSLDTCPHLLSSVRVISECLNKVHSSCAQSSSPLWPTRALPRAFAPPFSTVLRPGTSTTIVAYQHVLFHTYRTKSHGAPACFRYALLSVLMS